MSGPVEYRTIQEWLVDYFSMIEDTGLMPLLAGVAKLEVSSDAEARRRVNSAIDLTMRWLDGCRPAKVILE